MRAFRRGLITLTLAVSVGACGGARHLGPPSNPNIISREEIAAGSYRTAYDAVQSLHPNWLIKRGLSNAAQIWVYVDGTRYGDTSWLRNLPSTSVNSIQRIDATTATTRWGTGNSEGVIYVSTAAPGPVH